MICTPWSSHTDARDAEAREFGVPVRGLLACGAGCDQLLD